MFMMTSAEWIRATINYWYANKQELGDERLLGSVFRCKITKFKQHVIRNKIEKVAMINGTSLFYSSHLFISVSGKVNLLKSTAAALNVFVNEIEAKHIMS